MKFIAEFCQNHLGDKDLLWRMIDEAKDAGATHAKLQGLYSEELVYRSEYEDGSGKAEGLVRPFGPEVERLSGLDLSFEIEQEFVQRCVLAGITPMTTVFSHQGAERAIGAGFASFKIASYDCASLPMIERILPHATELVVSTGATDWKDVKNTSDLLKTEAHERTWIAFLHARTIYPTPLEEFRLPRMVSLLGLGYDIGLSDHSSPAKDGLDASMTAIWLGASVIERHFTVLSPPETKDGPVSVNPTQLRELVAFSSADSQSQLPIIQRILEETPGAMLCPSLDPDDVERVSALYYRGRVASWYGQSQVFAWQEWPADAER